MTNFRSKPNPYISFSHTALVCNAGRGKTRRSVRDNEGTTDKAAPLAVRVLGAASPAPCRAASILYAAMGAFVALGLAHYAIYAVKLAALVSQTV
jgi:hypothetical protein